jgi:hypothetical protein
MDRMYRVRREQQRIVVFHGTEILYEGAGEEYIVYRETLDAPKLTVKRIAAMTDDELLGALATAVQIQKP